MAKQKIPLGKILGIPIGLDYSWFLIFILLTWTLAVSYFPAEFSNWPAIQYWAIGAVTAIMLFVSVLLHELGHSAVALRYKVPVRSITLFIFGGVAQIESEPPSARAEFWIAIAGPAVSFSLAALFALLQPVFAALSPLLALARYLAYINGSLGLFNLIPGFPLDGGRVLRAILWGRSQDLHRATRIAAGVGKSVAFLFIVFGVWQMLGGNFGGGLWIAFIGWFLQSAASSQLNQEAMLNLFAGHTAAEAMDRNYRIISPETTLQTLWESGPNRDGRQRLIVGRSGDITGLLSMQNIEQVPRESWAATTVSQVMVPLERIAQVQPGTGLEDAVRSLEQASLGEIPVMEAGHLVGVLDRESIRAFLNRARAAGRS